MFGRATFRLLDTSRWRSRPKGGWGILIMLIDIYIMFFFLVGADKSNLMVGSYGPKTEEHIFTTRREEAPSGMLCRGIYKAKSRFTDDDKQIYLDWEWSFELKKEWE